jgi:Uroporphyrinogen decarboxylase (URO-D)
LRLAKGEIPEFVPIYTMGFPGYNNEIACKIIGPSLFDETHLQPAPTGRYDIWGVKYIANEETNFACIPAPNNYILEDITKWHDVIKKPEMPENIDWEKMAKMDCERVALDRSQSAAMAVIGIMPFQQFIAMMGFNNGFIAMYEEPEFVKELLHFMVDTYMPMIHAALDYYDPDLMYLLDDTASKTNTFISREMYRDILKPVYKRLTQPALERGVPIQFHNCGKCEDFMDDMIDYGARIWDPGQTVNDLDSFKKKYSGKLAVAGGYDCVPLDTSVEIDEENIRQSVRDSIDRYAPGGGYAFFGAALGKYGDKTIAKVNEWISEEAYTYGRDYYLK